MNRLWLFLFIGLLLVGLSTAARQPTQAEASLVASTFLRSDRANASRPLSIDDEEQSVAVLHGENGQILGYVYAVSPVGYVVIAASTELPPVIAYSLQSSFPSDPAESSTLVDLLRADLSLRMEALQRDLIPSASRARNEASWYSMSAMQEPCSAADGIVGPLLEAPTWSQDSPWNDSCPIDPSTGTRSSVGCGATALAQILSYYRYPSSVSFSSSDNYVTLARQISVEASAASCRSITYASKSHHNPDDEMMANLSHAAGVSVKMDYTSRGSGAYAVDIAVALAGSPIPMTSSRRPRPAVWQYESADIRTCVNSHWGAPFFVTASGFYDELRDDLDHGRPVVLCAVTAGTSTGHILICDGYESSTGRYHLNLGWGGGSDGWYALPEDMPPGYNVVEYGILNIRPPEGSSRTTGGSNGTGASSSSSTTSIDGVVAFPNPFSTHVTFRYEGLAVPTSISVAIYDLTGHILWTDEASGTSEIEWHGIDRHGERVANGPLLFVAVVIKQNSASNTKGKLFVLR